MKCLTHRRWRNNICVTYKIPAILVLCFFFTGQMLNAQEDIKERLLIDKEADLYLESISYEYRVRDDVYIATGDVVLRSGAIILSAQKAEYNLKTKIAKVSGGILLETGEDTLNGESGTFDFINQTGIINSASVFMSENNFNIKGGRIEKYGDNSYLITDFKLTTCDGDAPEWSITGSEIKVTLEGYGKLRNGTFRVKEIPVAYVPYLLFPAKTKRASGVLIPHAGFSSRNGMEVEVPVFWAISDSTDMTFYERYMTDRGLMQGLEVRYVSGIDSKGYFNFDILSDRIDKKDMNDPDQFELSPYERTNSGRYWLRGRIDQEFPSGITARLDADVVSDQDYLKEFKIDLAGFNSRPDYESEFNRPFEEFSSPLRSSTLRLSKAGEHYIIQALSSFYQRPEGFKNDTTPEPLAVLSFSMLPGFLNKLPLVFSLDSDYDYIWRDYGQKGHSLSISPEISYPVWFGRYLQFETVAGYTHDMQWLDNDTGNGTGSQSREVFHGKARLSTLLERVFDSDFMQVKRIKHKIVPSLAYEYRSHKDEDKYQPWFEAIDQEGSTNRILFSIDNSIDVKKIDEKGNITYSQWGSFRIAQGYDIDESRRDTNPEQKKEPFEPLAAELRFMPCSQINIDLETRWDHYRDDFIYADTGVRLDIEREGGLADIYRVDYVYNEAGSKGLGYYVNINLVKGFALGSSLQRDIEADHDVEKNFWIEYNSKCWRIMLGVQQYDEESRVMVGFRLSGFND